MITAHDDGKSSPIDPWQTQKTKFITNHFSRMSGLTFQINIGWLGGTFNLGDTTDLRRKGELCCFAAPLKWDMWRLLVGMVLRYFFKHVPILLLKEYTDMCMCLTMCFWYEKQNYEFISYYKNEKPNVYIYI